MLLLGTLTLNKKSIPVLQPVTLGKIHRTFARHHWFRTSWKWSAHRLM